VPEVLSSNCKKQ